MSSVSPGFIKWWPRCLNCNVAKASQSQRICEAVSDACLRLSQLGPCTSPSLINVLWNDSALLANLSLLLAGLCSDWAIPESPASHVEGLLRKPLASLISIYGLPMLLVFPAHPVHHPFGNLCRYTKCRLSFCEWLWGASCGLLISWFISINSHVSWHPCWLDPGMCYQFHQELMAVAN